MPKNPKSSRNQCVMYLTINHLNDKNKTILVQRSHHFYIESIQFPNIARSTLTQVNL